MSGFIPIKPELVIDGKNIKMVIFLNFTAFCLDLQLTWWLTFTLRSISIVLTCFRSRVSLTSWIHPVCLLLSEIAFSFLQKLDNVSPGSAVTDRLGSMLTPTA